MTSKILPGITSKPIPADFLSRVESICYLSKRGLSNTADVFWIRKMFGKWEKKDEFLRAMKHGEARAMTEMNPMMTIKDYLK